MDTMLVFLGICLILGLWVKPKIRYGTTIIAIAAFLLILYFWIRPQQL